MVPGYLNTSAEDAADVARQGLPKGWVKNLLMRTLISFESRKVPVAGRENRLCLHPASRIPPKVPCLTSRSLQDFGSGLCVQG
ncbi:basic proline-rich protein-like [Grus japonensis]|uniref:Basic proline-rich protein-like n=1 Tax=Grus japonensis TaxID=30415 RepID=A0ABC9X8V5_GRUJA